MNPIIKKIVFGQLRHLLTVASGVLVTKGYLDASMAEAFVGIATGFVGAGWSAVEKRRG